VIWAGQQRAIDELMIVEQYGKALRMEHATFRDRCDDTFAPWCEALRDELAEESAGPRLRDIQHLLCELVETLDARRVRYTQNLDSSVTAPGCLLHRPGRDRTDNSGHGKPAAPPACHSAAAADCDGHGAALLLVGSGRGTESHG
jgi:hypothetical protein